MVALTAVCTLRLPTRIGSSLNHPDIDVGVTAAVVDSEWSCLVVRQRCLRDVPRCSRLLADFRAHCRENRKHDQCIASDW